MYAIDVTNESRNKSELKKLLHTLKTNLNKNQDKDVKDKILNSESSVLVNELMACYENPNKMENKIVIDSTDDDDEDSDEGTDDENKDDEVEGNSDTTGSSEKSSKKVSFRFITSAL